MGSVLVNVHVLVSKDGGGVDSKRKGAGTTQGRKDLRPGETWVILVRQVKDRNPCIGRSVEIH